MLFRSKTISVTDKTGKLVGILDVTATEDLMITCRSGVTIRMPVSGISEQGRATQGVKLIKLDETDEIAAITKLDKLEEMSVPAAEGTVTAVDGAADATADGGEGSPGGDAGDGASGNEDGITDTAEE